MERIEGEAVGRCAASPYLLPLRLHYRQNGTQKSWDFMKTHDSVTILMFNSSRRSLVLVKQFRPADAVSTRRSGVGVTGSSQTTLYAGVTDAQRGAQAGGPGGGEHPEAVHLPLDGARAFADDPDVPKTLGVIFGISWFLSRVAPGLGPQ
eukprot:bmy_17372T0